MNITLKNPALEQSITGALSLCPAYLVLIMLWFIDKLSLKFASTWSALKPGTTACPG